MRDSRWKRFIKEREAQPSLVFLIKFAPSPREEKGQWDEEFSLTGEL
jgi:hypothetical protein